MTVPCAGRTREVPRVSRRNLLPFDLLGGVLDIAQGGMGRGQDSHRHPEWRTTDVVQSDLVTELDAAWITAMFTTYAQFDPRIGLAPEFAGHAHQLSHTLS